MPFANADAVGADELDGVARLEATLDTGHADREQACAVVRERAAGAVVDVDPARDRLAVEEPELERGRRAPAGLETRAARLARDDRPEHVCVRAGGDHGRDARPRRRAPRPATLLCMPPLPSGEPAPSSAAPASAPNVEQLGPRRARRARVDALDLGQQHEQPRADEDRDLRRQRVVVAERDLVGRGRVVLVHDRHRAEREQRRQRVAGVEVRGPVGHVDRGQQHLRRGQPLAAERLVPDALEPRLPERRRRLQLRQAPRASRRARAAAARARSRPTRRRRPACRRGRARRSRRHAPAGPTVAPARPARRRATSRT